MNHWTKLSPSFRDVLTLLAVLVIMFLIGLMSGCASVPKPPAEDVVLSEKVKASCAEEGGCALVTRKRLDRELQRAFAAGVQAGEKRRSAL
jgi:hypothetical protein